MSVEIFRNGYERIPHEYKVFPGGEPHVVISNLPSIADWFLLNARIRSFNDLGELLAVTNAVKKTGARLELFIPYFPGARQDRRFPNGAFTAKVYADIINAQGYSKVSVLDPHSDVVPALLNNVHVVDSCYMAAAFVTSSPFVGLISPDAGSTKRTEAVAEVLRKDFGVTSVPILYGRKHRDATTGDLSGFKLDAPEIVGRYVVIDDICDGGGTFLGLAAEFRKFKLALGSWAGVPVQSTLDLWVTHGIFSMGLKDLLIQYDRIGTTDSIFLPEHSEWLRHKSQMYVRNLVPNLY